MQAFSLSLVVESTNVIRGLCIASSSRTRFGYNLEQLQDQKEKSDPGDSRAFFLRVLALVLNVPILRIETFSLDAFGTKAKSGKA